MLLNIFCIDIIAWRLYQGSGYYVLLWCELKSMVLVRYTGCFWMEVYFFLCLFIVDTFLDSSTYEVLVSGLHQWGIRKIFGE